MFFILSFVLFRVIVGVVIGISLARFFFFRRGRWYRRHGMHRGPWRVIQAIRALRLDAAQRGHLRTAMVELGRLRTEMRFARFDAVEEMSAAVTGDTFDRARVEAFLDKQAASFQRARGVLLDEMAAVHASLSPEQRQHLRDTVGHAVGQASEPGPASPHPFR